ncbi:DUF1552 domain-containing protein [Echinicola vietnamensis]|uniref:DUF1552 domain-containing protein n=1 Tax=Echinicola vietnamensis (strain DSM 17526 / LMG 23754 / KMM 6221) TaxID=926556 RepID=L0FXZ0_ECHVK|nr:DUF1552 domain-containing protein [Echinicola vietnamensis]AGA78162.1 Protein of unknown function (DUF1552) [Echinicola vietnamensis DSM 17526]
MGKKSWELDRRTFLKGLGVACMLPYMEAMGGPIQQLSSMSEAPKRLCFVYFPNGVGLPPKDNPHHSLWNWFPIGRGKDYRFTKTLSPLERHRKEITIMGGLSHPKSRHLLGHLAGDTWLTGGDLRGSQYNNSISVDQVAAQHLAKHTRFPYLALSSDGGIGYKSRVSTLSFDPNGRPIPSEHRHREIFERYFAPGGGETSQLRRKSLKQEQKIVDLVLADSKRLQKKLGKNDQMKLDEYMTSLNTVEEQIKRNEKWLNVPMKDFNADHINLNPNATVDPESYIRSSFDLMVLGMQTDITRVMTYMIAREDGMGFGENYPKLALGLNKGHHSISHDKSKNHWQEWGSYDQWLAKQYAYFLDKMKSTEDEYGPLLDNTLVLYGSACSSTHDAVNYPLVLAGGKNMGVKHGTYVDFQEEFPMSNLFVSMLHTLGIPVDTFSDSTGKLETDILG